jgi:hypothetical protein
MPFARNLLQKVFAVKARMKRQHDLNCVVLSPSDLSGQSIRATTASRFTRPC